MITSQNRLIFFELEARCRAVLGRQDAGASNLKRFGDIEFDGLAGTVSL